MRETRTGKVKTQRKTVSARKKMRKYLRY